MNIVFFLSRNSSLEILFYIFLFLSLVMKALDQSSSKFLGSFLFLVLGATYSLSFSISSASSLSGSSSVSGDNVLITALQALSESSAVLSSASRVESFSHNSSHWDHN